VIVPKVRFAVKQRLHGGRGAQPRTQALDVKAAPLVLCWFSLIWKNRSVELVTQE